MKIQLKKMLVTTLVLLSVMSINAFAVTQHKVRRHKNMSMVSRATQFVNINRADKKQLMTLEGIGEKKAIAIVAYRGAHGKFRTLEDLVKVKGISAKTVKHLQAKNPNRIKVG